MRLCVVQHRVSAAVHVQRGLHCHHHVTQLGKVLCRERKAPLLMKKILFVCLLNPSPRYLDEGAVPEARVERDDCITVHAPQGALYLHAFCPLVTGLGGTARLLNKLRSITSFGCGSVVRTRILDFFSSVNRETVPFSPLRLALAALLVLPGSYRKN